MSKKKIAAILLAATVLVAGTLLCFYDPSPSKTFGDFLHQFYDGGSLFYN